MANNHKFSIIVKPLMRIDAIQKVTGETKYADDLLLTRMPCVNTLPSAPAFAHYKR